MTTQIINDPASLERLGKLLAGMEASSAEWQAQAERCHQTGDVVGLEEALTVAYIAQDVAKRVRARLVALSGLTEADVQQPVQPLVPRSVVGPEPPHQLVPFVEWLRARIGRYLPWVSAETWQRAAFVLLWERRS